MRNRVEGFTDQIMKDTLESKLVEGSRNPYVLGIGWVGD